jgi:hypothetical protein
MKIFVYRSPDDCVERVSRHASFDAACDAYLDANNIVPDEIDCIADRIVIVYTKNDVIVIADQPQLDIHLRDIYH